MKRMSKLLALVLTLVMALSLVNTAFAADETDETITLTIEGSSGMIYSVYRMFDIEAAANSGFKYKGIAGWESFITNNAADYFTVQEVDGNTKYILWKKGTSVSPADGAALAQLARDYVKTAHGLTYQTLKAGETVELAPYGYYLIVPSGNTPSGLITVLNENISVVEKVNSSSMPSVTKEVMEDSTGKYGAANDADIGQILHFQTTITAGADARNYVLHDKMDADHMQFVAITEITRGGNTVPQDQYEVVKKPAGCACAFHIKFSEAFCRGLHEDAIIVVKYTAKLTNEATADMDHINETWLTHIDDKTETLHATTITKTYDITVKKVDQYNNPLAGATFVLKDNVGMFYKWDDNGVSWVAEADEATQFVTTTTGEGNNNATFTIRGVDAEIFTLIERIVPQGYTGQSEIEINTKEKNKDSDNNVLTTQSKTVTVTNVLGTQLPTTGGMGTTLFYVGGGLLVAAAVVLLALKKRKAE